MREHTIQEDMLRGHMPQEDMLREDAPQGHTLRDTEHARKVRDARKNGRRGETLIETLVGVLIVSMASGVLVAGISSAVRVNKDAREEKAAQQFTYEADAAKTEDETIEIKDTKGISLGSLEATKNEDANGYIWYTTK